MRIFLMFPLVEDALMNLLRPYITRTNRSGNSGNPYLIIIFILKKGWGVGMRMRMIPSIGILKKIKLINIYAYTRN